ncbi:MAG: NADPH-dependent FMN reductase [Halobacteriaceae archaeon]
MDDPSGPHVAGIAGSLRDESYTRVSLGHALDAAVDAGATTDLVDLRDLDLPLFDADRDQAGDADVLRDRVAAADAVVLATPVYHGSYSSPLKTALDYCGFDEFEHKTVGLLAVGGGSFPVTALEHLRSVCRSLGAWVLPHQAAVPRARKSVDVTAGEVTDDDVADRIGTLGHRAVEYARIEPDPLPFEGEQNVGADD